MDCQCAALGIPIGFPLHPHCIRIGFPTGSRCISMRYPSDIHWIPCGVPFDSHLVSIGAPFGPHGFPNWFPLDCNWNTLGFQCVPNLMLSWFLFEIHGCVFRRVRCLFKQIARPSLHGSVAAHNQARLAWARTLLQFHQAWFFICFDNQRAQVLCMPTRFASHWIPIGFPLAYNLAPTVSPFDFRCTSVGLHLDFHLVHT